jgi:hypothetical protein
VPRVLSSLLSPRLILPLAVVIGLYVRLLPNLLHPGLPAVSDAAYHVRMVEQTVRSGRLPAVDSLSNAPEGRRTARELPVGLYTIGALAHRGLSALGSRDLRWNLALLVALCGGLIALPVWLGTRVAFGSSVAASLAAACAVMIPAHLGRSYGFWLRYDALGTLLAVTHVALAMVTLASSQPRQRFALAAASAFCLVAAVWVWRVSFIVLALELAFVVYRFASRGPEPALRDLWLAIALIGTPGFAAIEYLRARGFVLSPPWLFAIGLAIALCVPPFRAGRALRVGAMAAAAALAVALGWSHIPAGYAGLGTLVPARLGLVRGHDPVAVLMTEVQELGSISLWTLVAGSQELFVLGAWLLAAPALFWWLAGRPRPARWNLAPAAALLALVTAGLGAGTLLFERASVLLAPFTAMTLGGLGAMLAQAPAPAPAPSPAPAARRGHKSPQRGTRIRRGLAAALALSAIATCAAGIDQALTSGSSVQPSQEEAIDFLRDHTPRDAVILSFWDAGYDIQARAARATAMDGLLESDENRRRIFAFDSALMAPTPELLERLCARYRARWFLVPPLPYIYTVAAVAGDPIAAKIARGEELQLGIDTERVLYHLMEADVPVPRFRLAFQAAGYRVYEYVPPG